MCRIDPALHNAAIAKKGCKTMVFTQRPMSGYVMIEQGALKTKKTYLRMIRVWGALHTPEK